MIDIDFNSIQWIFFSTTLCQKDGSESKLLIKENETKEECKKGIKTFLRFNGGHAWINSQLLFSLINKNDGDKEMGLEKKIE